jgi:isoprenylcysteine carboxyl methyltransferase (ICMT) family protein YpbQ
LDAEIVERSPGLTISLANLAALRQRIRIEERALAEIVVSVGGASG